MGQKICFWGNDDLYVRNEWVLTKYTESDFQSNVLYDLSTEKSIKVFFISVTVFFLIILSSTFFDPFLTIHLCLNYLSHLNISYKILIMLILNSLSDNCNISVISESRSDDCFVVSDWELFCLLFCLVVFWWNPGLIYWVTGTEVKRTLVWGFILTWLRVGLCLMFVPEASNSSNVLMP